MHLLYVKKALKKILDNFKDKGKGIENRNIKSAALSLTNKKPESLDNGISIILSLFNIKSLNQISYFLIK